jgi:ribonuclease M5
MKKNKIYVVEGLHDEAHLKQLYPGIMTLSVGGSAVNNQAINFLIEHQNMLDIHLLFDPDYPGEKIRKFVAEKLETFTHIFINIEDARYKRKIGIEHVRKEVLDEAFLHGVTNQTNHSLSYQDFISLNLTGSVEAKQRRDVVCKKLHLGYSNAKTLFKRLNVLGITKESVMDILNGTPI